jgi:hypothetical protein
MLEDAEHRSIIGPAPVVIERTSGNTGNTGNGLALVCAVKRYRLVLCMPESFSVEGPRSKGNLNPSFAKRLGHPLSWSLCRSSSRERLVGCHTEI